MSMLPSPIPHPLDHCPWDVPGWIYEALDWVVGVEWPEGNERAVWDLADQWYGVADILTAPRDDTTAAAGEVRSGYGGVGLVAEVFDIAWRKVAEGEDAPLHAVLAITGELGKVVESCGCDIEGAKLEAWIELGILVVELLSLAVATVLTLGAASPAAGAAVTASRMVVQQIFKRLVAQLARKAIKEGLKEAGERAAKEVVKSGARGLARRAAIGALVEAGQEAGTSLATQAYQNSTGRRDGLDLTDIGGSGLGGLAGGAVAPLAGLGRHAHGPLTQIGERFGREMAGETLAEGAAGLAVGQGLSLEDLARAAVSGASGSATGQADAAMHHRLDGKLAGLASPPVDLSLPPSADAIDTASLIPTQRTSETVGPVAGDALPRPAAQPDAAVVHSVAAGQHEAAATSLPLDHLSSPVQPDRSAVDASRLPAHPVADLDADRSHAEAAVRPTLSSVTVESPVAGTPPVTVDPKPGPVHTAPTADPAAPSQPAPVQTNAAPTVVPPPQQHVRFATDPVPAPSGPDPDNRPTQNPRFPLLESLAPAPRPAHDPSPPLPGRVDPLPPRRSAPQEPTARQAAEQDALDRRRYQEHLESQREWYEENRRQQEAEWLRVRADRLNRSAVEYREQARQLRRNGQELLAQQWQTAAHGASSESYELRERAQQVLAGSLVPAEVTVEDNANFHRINDDVADLARGAVETSDRSSLTGDGHPPPIDRSRRYGTRGGLRPPLALHQTDLERQMPRNPNGSVLRTADPRHGGWFGLANDGGPLADATRSINCLDCTLSLYETWVHGRPRVSAPRTFDGYLIGDVRQPVGGEDGGPERVEEITGGRFQDLCPGPEPATDLQAEQRVEQGYRDLHRQLRAGGHGSYAFLITSWEGGGSHAWVALNQNGTVLYLDPQRGLVLDHPLYGHSGVSSKVNVVGIDALILGPDGRPMPVDGRPPGIYNVLPELRERPEPRRPPDPYDGEPAPDFNRVYLLGEDTTFHRPADPPPPGSAPDLDPDDAIRTARLGAHADRIAAGIFVKDAVGASGNLDEVFAAGVTPVELAQHLDPTALRRMVPGLDQAAAGDVVRLLGDPRVQQMLDQTWEAPSRGELLLAEMSVRQLTQRPDLVRMILATPELANSLTARPLTLHHLASYQKAIDVLGDVLDDIAERGPAVIAAEIVPEVEPTPLTEEQRQASVLSEVGGQLTVQPGFNETRRGDPVYRRQYLDHLYEAAELAQVEIDGLGRRLAESSRGQAEFEGRSQPKDRQRAEDKVVKYGGLVSRLKDLAAGRVSYQRLTDLYDALETLRNAPGIEIAEYEDRFLVPQASGYRDIQMMLRTSTGHIAELRLELAPLNEVAEWEHALYEVKRDLEAVAAEQGRSLSTTELAIRNGILQQERHYFWQALQLALGGGSNT